MMDQAGGIREEQVASGTRGETSDDRLSRMRIVEQVVVRCGVECDCRMIMKKKKGQRTSSRPEIVGTRAPEWLVKG